MATFFDVHLPAIVSSVHNGNLLIDNYPPEEVAEPAHFVTLDAERYPAAITH